MKVGGRFVASDVAERQRTRVYFLPLGYRADECVVRAILKTARALFFLSPFPALYGELPHIS